MELSVIWFILFVLIIAGYLILDGFDFGVGILHMVLARSDNDRRIFLNSIGPVWDGNEVWLVVGGGVLFAAFPPVYATLFSGFYTAMLLVLLFLILRTVAIEFRSKESSPIWRTSWDTVFAVSSFALAMLFGVAFGNIISGVPLDAEGVISMPFLALLGPFPILIGLTTVVMTAMHGALYLNLKTEGELQARVQQAIPWLMIAFVVLNTLAVITTVLFRAEVTTRYLTEFWPIIFPAGALGAMAYSWGQLRQGKNLWAFFASGAVIALLLLAVAVGIFPNLLISSTDPANNMTIFNAVSQPNTLTVMLIMAAIGMPFVLLYTAGVYYIFRGKVKLTDHSY